MKTEASMNTKPCGNCGHPQDWHRHDDADNVPPTDPACKFRCIGYDCEVAGRPPVNPCACPDFVEMKSETNKEMLLTMKDVFRLRLANAKEIIHAHAAGSSSGQGELMGVLTADPIAIQVLRDNNPRRLDHVHLTRYDATNVVQWLGRNARGYHVEIGPMMQIELIDRTEDRK